MSTGTRTDAIVVGAGCGGLVAAWQLAQSGCDVTLLDAWKWPGGLLPGAELGGLRVDVGAEGYSVRGGGVEQLLHKLGAAELIATPNPLGAWVQGEGDVLRTTRNMLFAQGLVTADGVPVLRVSGIFKMGALIGDGTDRDPLRLRR